MGQLLLKGLFITVTPLRFHPSLPSSDVTRPHRNNVAHPSKPTPSTVCTQTHANTHAGSSSRPHRNAHTSSVNTHTKRAKNGHLNCFNEINAKTRICRVSVCVCVFSPQFLSNMYYKGYTAHNVHFPLCYFIDCGHNYPLF